MLFVHVYQVFYPYHMIVLIVCFLRESYNPEELWHVVKEKIALYNNKSWNIGSPAM